MHPLYALFVYFAVLYLTGLFFGLGFHVAGVLF